MYMTPTRKRVLNMQKVDGAPDRTRADSTVAVRGVMFASLLRVRNTVMLERTGPLLASS